MTPAGQPTNIAASVRTQPQHQGVLPKHAVSKGVKGGDPGIGEAVRNQQVDTPLHLRRRLLGKGQRQHLLRPDSPAVDRVGDPVRAITVVFPVPAPAMISNGPSPCVTAACWATFKPSRSVVPVSETVMVSGCTICC